MKTEDKIENIVLENQDGLPLHVLMYELISLCDKDLQRLRYTNSEKYQTDMFIHYTHYKPISKMLSREINEIDNFRQEI
jgi:hypothetical protein